MKTIIITLSLFVLLLAGCSDKKTASELITEGEKFANEENLPEAVLSYETLINDYPDDALAPEVTLRLATVYQNYLLEDISENESLLKSIELYEKLIKKYPEDVLAPEATVRLAAIYQNKLVKNISENESLLKSVELFKSIYEKHPGSEQAPLGLFMAGFVQSNELQDFEDASETYNLFLKVFPDHELAASAKEELDNMGLTPEEILQKNLARQE